MGRAMDDLIRMSQELREQERARRRNLGIEPYHLRRENEISKLIDSAALRARREEGLLSGVPSSARRDYIYPLESARASSSSALNALTGLKDFNSRIRAAEQLNIISPSWRREVEDLRRLNAFPNARMESALGIHVARITERTLLAQGALTGLNRRDLGSALGAADASRGAVIDRFSRFADSYGRLIESFGQPRTGILTLPPRLSELSSVEFFNEADLLRATSLSNDIEDEFEEDRQELRVEIAAETDSTLPALLSDLNPELLRLWEGARQARRSSNPDRVRHFATSLRELLTHVMHRLSPDDELRAWSSSPTDFADNRPTRKARLRFIARGIDHGPFTQFVEKDIAATLAAFNLFHVGTHAISSSLKEAQLAALQAKVESAIYFMLMTARGEQGGGH